MKLEVKLFGIPEVTLDGKLLKWPSKKSKMLFIYVLINKKVNRTYLADLFWGDKGSINRASQSLRNCIYTMRKTFDINFIVKDDKDELIINPSLEIEEKDLMNNQFLVETVTAPFLNGMELKNNDLYNEWLYSKQQEMSMVVIENSYSRIEDLIEKKVFETAIRLCYRIQQIDIYDERTYKYLVEIYACLGQYPKVMSIYKDLETLYREDLAIAPSADIKMFVNALRRKRTEKIAHHINDNTNKACQLFSREEELKQIFAEIKVYLSGRKYKSLAILGEDGIGKSTIIKKIVEDVDACRVIETQCYKAEKNFILKPWYPIISALSDDIMELMTDMPEKNLLPIVTLFPILRTNKLIKQLEFESMIYSNYEVIEREVVYLIEKIIEKKRLVIVFEDIHWIDDASLSLIRNIMASRSNHSVLFILSSRKTMDQSVANFFAESRKDARLKTIELNRWNEDTVIDFVNAFYNQLDLSQDALRLLYRESEGNPYYLHEIINNYMNGGKISGITDSIRQVLTQRMSDLNQDEKTILESLSTHFAGATLKFFIHYSLYDELKLVNILESLIAKGLIKEKAEEDTIRYSFEHLKMQEFIYSEMTLAKKRILHNKSGSIYEEMIADNPFDSSLYSMIIYHFDQSGNNNKFMVYNIKYLYNYLCVVHEFFPVVNYPFKSKISFEKKYIENQFNVINEWIKTLNFDTLSQDEKNNISNYYHMVSRYYIRVGENETGMKFINRMKQLNSDQSESSIKNLINANRQLVCIYMNLYDEAALGDVIEKALAYSDYMSEEDRGIWLRLKGYHCLMKGDYVSSRAYLSQSVTIFENTVRAFKYVVNQAAALNWIGETYRLEKEFNLGLTYYNQAISLCEDKEILGGTPLFYVNKGQCYFDMADYDQALECFDQSIALYETTDSIWGKSLPYSYRAIISMKQGKIEAGEDDLEISKKLVGTIMSKYEEACYRRSRTLMETLILD